MPCAPGAPALSAVVAWSPSSVELEQFAARVNYEVERALLQGLDPMIGERREGWSHRHDALVESALGHLRALDRFFRHDTEPPPTVSRAARRTVLHSDGVVARHYAPTWPRTGFLTRQDRIDINARLAYLAGRPLVRREWDVRRMTLDLARVFLDFYRSLDDAGRGWFSRTRAIAIRELANAERKPPAGEASELQRST
jgi:hypothetical protein